MKQYAKEILISLIDKYERSKVSDGNNQIRVSVKLATEKIFRKTCYRKDFSEIP